MSGWIEWNHRRAGRVVEKADDDGHHVSQRSDAKESIIGAGMRHKSGVLGGVPWLVSRLVRTRFFTFFYRTSPGVNQRFLSVMMSDTTHKTMPYSRRHAQDKEITFKFAANATAEHRYTSTLHGAWPWSVRVRTFKARTAFPVGPLARGGGGCMELDVPAFITGRCLSLLVAQATTGVSRTRGGVRDVGAKTFGVNHF